MLMRQLLSQVPCNTPQQMIKYGKCSTSTQWNTIQPQKGEILSRVTWMELEVK